MKVGGDRQRQALQPLLLLSNPLSLLQIHVTCLEMETLCVVLSETPPHLPQIHGTCLGMETLCVVLSENYTILGDFDAEDAAAPLLYTDLADESHFFRRWADPWLDLYLRSCSHTH